MENSRELFIKAFLEAERISNTQFQNISLENVSFSKSFEEEMDRLIKKDNRIRLSARRNIKKGLLAAIVAIVVAFTGLMSVSATRLPFVEFIKKVFPQFNEIMLSEDSTPPVNEIEIEYTLSDLPKGFEIKEYQKDEFGIFTVWGNKNNDDEIAFSQEILDTDLLIDTEHNYKEITVNGYEAYLNQYEFNSSLIWTDGNYWFVISVPYNLSDELINMAENISEKK